MDEVVKWWVATPQLRERIDIVLEQGGLQQATPVLALESQGHALPVQHLHQLGIGNGTAYKGFDAGISRRCDAMPGVIDDGSAARLPFLGIQEELEKA